MSKEQDSVVLHYYDVTLRQSDLDTIIPGQWVNDTMIAFHMEFLARTFVPKDANYLFARPSMVQLITFAQEDVLELLPTLPPHIEFYEVIFIPVNNGKPSVPSSGTHWSLLVYVRAPNTFYYYDTFKFNNLREGEYASRRFQPLLKLKHPAKFIPSKTPQQENGSDCGVHVMSIIDYTLHQLLRVRGEKEHIHYNEIMDLKPLELSTPAQIRKDLNNMIKRLQQRSKCSHY